MKLIQNLRSFAPQRQRRGHGRRCDHRRCVRRKIVTSFVNDYSDAVLYRAAVGRRAISELSVMLKTGRRGYCETSRLAAEAVLREVGALLRSDVHRTFGDHLSFPASSCSSSFHQPRSAANVPRPRRRRPHRHLARSLFTAEEVSPTEIRGSVEGRSDRPLHDADARTIDCGQARLLPAQFFGIRDLCTPLRDMMPTDAAGSAGARIYQLLL